MSSQNKIKWILVEQRGGREIYPLMPSVLTLYRIVTSEKFSQATGLKYEASFLLDLKKSRDKDYIHNYVKKSQWDKFCNLAYQKVRKNPEIQKKLINEFQKRVPKFLSFSKKIYADNLEKKSNKKLWQYYQKYIQLFEDIYVWGEPFAFGTRFQLSDYLSEYLKGILKKRNTREKFDEYFNILITPKEKPFITEERKTFKNRNRDYEKTPIKNSFQERFKTN